MNVEKLEDRMMLMKPQELQQFASMHKNDPYILPLAMRISEMRKKFEVAQGMQYVGQQPPTVAEQSVASMKLPEDQGIGQLPAQNIAKMADGGIAGYAAGTEKPIFDPDKYLEMPNVQRYLAYINMYEGSPKPNELVGHKPFESLAAHPRQSVVFNKKGDESTAAGMYQFIGSTWEKQRKKLGLKDFSPENQQRAAVGLLKDLGALDDVVAGKYDAATAKAKKEWASLPGSTIGKATGQFPKVNPKAEAYLRGVEPAQAVVAADKAEKVAEAAKPPGMLESVWNSIKKQLGDRADAGILGMLPGMPSNAISAYTAPIKGEYFEESPGMAEIRDIEQQKKPSVAPPRGTYVEPSVKKRLEDYIIGAPEAWTSVATGAISPATHLLPYGLSKLTGIPKTQAEAISDVTFIPRSEEGLYALKTTEQGFEAGKVPPFIPGIHAAPLKPKRPLISPKEQAGRVKRLTAAEQALADSKKGQLDLGLEEGGSQQGAAADAALRKAQQEAIDQQRNAEAARNATDTQRAQDAQMSMFSEAEAPPTSAIKRVLKPIDQALENARSANERRSNLKAQIDEAARNAEEARRVELERERIKAAENVDSGNSEITKTNANKDVYERSLVDNANRNAVKDAVTLTGQGADVAQNAVDNQQDAAPAAPAEIPVDYDAWTKYYKDKPAIGAGGPETFDTKVEDPAKPPVTAAGAATAEKKTGLAGLTDDDYLTMGLNLLAAGPRKGNMLQDLMSNVGTAGLATLGARREREKTAGDKAYREAQMGYTKALGESLNRPTEATRSLQELADNPKLQELQTKQAILKQAITSIDDLYKIRGMTFDEDQAKAIDAKIAQYEALINKFAPADMRGTLGAAAPAIPTGVTVTRRQ